MVRHFIEEIVVERFRNKSAFLNRENKDMTTSLCVAQHAGDAGRKAGPALGFGGQLLLAGSGHLINPGAAFILRDRPGCGDPSDFFHAMKSRVERSFVDAEGLVG